MSTTLRWLKRIGAALVALAVAAVLTIWILSNRLLYRQQDLPVARIAVPGDSASIARGEHLIAILGCEGCHGEKLEGEVFIDEPYVARIIAPNLTEAIKRYSDDSLAFVIRDGINADTRPVLVMPSDAFYNLSDGDVGALIAALRLRPPVQSDSVLPATAYRILGRFGLVMGAFKTAPDHTDRSRPRHGESADTTALGRGAYLAMTSCIECHGDDLRGDAGTPSLAGAYGYSLEEFVHLARTRQPRDTTRVLGTMAQVALSRLANMTDGELADLHGYLRSIPAVAPAAQPD
jgi:mono/diheme cytochrome c family protein